MNTAQGFPNISVPPIGPDGRWNQVWYMFLISLFNRTGGAPGSDSSAIQAQLNALAAKVLSDEQWIALNDLPSSSATIDQLLAEMLCDPGFPRAPDPLLPEMIAEYPVPTRYDFDQAMLRALLIGNDAPDVPVARSNLLGISRPDGTTVTISNGVLSSVGLGGTVTSVGLSAPAPFTVTGSPVTSSGTLALTFASVGTGSLVLQSYVDAAIQGLSIKPTAAVATTTLLPANTYSNGGSGVGATLTATATGVLTVDGVAAVLGALILVKNEAAAANNGLYTVTTAGAVGVAYVLTRHTDMDQATEFSGAFIPVSSAGTVNANSLWLANPSGTVVIGTTAIPFTQLNGATDLIAGGGITISGNTISISTTYAGQASIATVGTITTGTWSGTPVAVASGGTGAVTASAARTNLGLTIGTNVEAWSATLDSVAAGSYAGAPSIITLGTVATGTWNAGAVTSSASLTGKRLVGNSTTPGMVTNTGAGTSPTGVTITGTDIAGKISFTAGTGPVGNAQIVLLTFSAAFASAPFTVFSPNSTGAAALSGPSGIQTSTSTTQMAFTSGPTPLTAGTIYSWFYHNIG